MKRIVLSIFLLLGYVFCQAQEIKPQQVTADDYIRIFEDMGYKVANESIKNVKITLAPAERGKTLGIYFNETNGITSLLTFQEQTSPTGEINESYGYRRFKLDGSKIEDFYPLVLLGSYWYDPDADMFRFCGENDLSSDLTEDFIDNIPEYYIIGISLVK